MSDIRRLVTDDTLAVVEELRALRNVHYNDRPVSIYGGMVDLPLVVTRPDGRQFFDEKERDEVTGGALWAEWDGRQGSGLGAMERELRENLLGDVVWRRLELEVRTFVTAAERDFRANRADAAYDFSLVLVNFSKALEVQCNVTLRRALAKAPEKARFVHLETGTVDLSLHRALTLRQLARALSGEPDLARAVGASLVDSRWFLEQLPPVLNAFAEIRNPATHEARVGRAVATEWRDRLLGVGCEGVLVQLARVRLR